MKTSPLEIVENISVENFKQNYLKPQRPVVIKGLTKNTVAGEKWSIDYIKKVCGDVMVDVFDNANLNKETAFTNPDLKMPFRDYVSSITRPEPSSLRMFLFNMFKEKPELRKEFPCPPHIKGYMGKLGLMFFGAKGIKVRIHQDMDFSNVLLTQFHGRKRVVLIAPKYSRLLYKLPFNTHSLVDLDAPDYKRYPGLEHVECLECVLEPGDSVFMPSGYWHYITYLDGGFSVSYRHMAQSYKPLLQGVLSLAVYMPLDKFLHFLFTKRWFSFKEQLADKRAKMDLDKHRPSSDSYEELATG